MIMMFYDASAFNQELCWDLTGIQTHQMFYNSQGKLADCE